jgi:hypothetical protein
VRTERLDGVEPGTTGACPQLRGLVEGLPTSTGQGAAADLDDEVVQVLLAF